MHYDGRRWEGVGDNVVSEEIRRGVMDYVAKEVKAGADHDRTKKLSSLLHDGRRAAILRMARGYLNAEGEDFDNHRHLLNAGNGVVDLRNGSMRPHDPALLFTKVTPVDYVRGAVHEDWKQALQALPEDAVEWLRVRLGQGLFGGPPPDDLLVILKGTGENGKTTLIDGIKGAVGKDYAVKLPDKVLLARTGDHPTEMMTLRGARLAYMEELPEMGHLNVKRLKDTVGTGEITARYIAKNNVTWTATHTMFVTTNYLPRVDESDHGTWRRLALVNFPYRFRKGWEELEGPNDRHGDPDLRDRLRRGVAQHQAVLAWLIEGAVKSHQNGMPEPPQSVTEATREWRRSADLLLRYMDDRLVFDPNSHVIRSDLYDDFTAWLNASGHREWSDQVFHGRFLDHPEVSSKGVEKKKGVRYTQPGRSRPLNPSTQVVPNQYNAVMGVGFSKP
jgi:P4 family phage/plasmid primase-like protien